jgi:hypothetical protein
MPSVPPQTEVVLYKVLGSYEGQIKIMVPKKKENFASLLLEIDKLN